MKSCWWEITPRTWFQRHWRNSSKIWLFTKKRGQNKNSPKQLGRLAKKNPRKSPKERKQTDFYQAGLNSIQTTRGYVDSSGRYRSYSRDRNDQRPASSQNYSGQQSRSDSRARLRTPSGGGNASSRPNYQQSSDYRRPSQSPYRARSPYSSQHDNQQFCLQKAVTVSLHSQVSLLLPGQTWQRAT